MEQPQSVNMGGNAITFMWSLGTTNGEVVVLLLEYADNSRFPIKRDLIFTITRHNQHQQNHIHVVP